MTDSISVQRTIPAGADEIFAGLVDPRRHRDFDASKTVLDLVEGDTITGEGDAFVMDMYNEQGPTGGAYRMENTVTAFDPGPTIAWRPFMTDEFRPAAIDNVKGWEWRYDLRPEGDATNVTLTYDWTDVPMDAREMVGFPPFSEQDLAASLELLEQQVAR